MLISHAQHFFNLILEKCEELDADMWNELMNKCWNKEIDQMWFLSSDLQY